MVINIPSDFKGELLNSKHLCLCPGINEAVILHRLDVKGERVDVAYIVPENSCDFEQMREELRLACTEQYQPDQFVFLSQLPIADDGCVDLDRLRQHEVIDDSLADHWKEAIQQFSEVDQVEVIPVDKTIRVGSIHRLDLLGEMRLRHGCDPAVLLKQSVIQLDVVRCETLPVPAFVEGDELILSDDHPLTLGDALRAAASQYSNHGITYVNQDGEQHFQSYPQLLTEAEKFLFGLSSIGLKQGDRVILQLQGNQEFLVAFWGCILGGVTPVPLTVAPVYISSNATVQKLLNVWQMLDKPIVLASRELVGELQSIFNLSEFGDASVVAMESVSKEGIIPQCTIAPDDLALLLLTSGSTGLPKAVMHSHQTLLNRSASSVYFNRFGSGDVSLNWMPLDHVGGIVMFHLRDVFSGCNQIQVATEWILGEPLRWLDLIEQHKVNVTWAPNFAYALVNDKTDELTSRQWDLSSMRHFLNGGEAVVAKTARRFLRLLMPFGLASTAMKPAWGMSETASGITDSHDFSLETTHDSDRSVAVGMPMPNISLRIVDEHNQLLLEGEKGRLQVKGSCIMSGYYKNPEANNTIFTEDDWLDTGDVGYIQDGSLMVTARIKDEIIINGVNYLPTEIEVVVDSIDGVEVTYSVACAAQSDESNTDELIVFFSPVSSSDKLLAETISNIREQVVASVGIKPSYVIPLEKSQIPKTNIGKIQRAKLKALFENNAFEKQLKHSDLLTGTNTIPDWFFEKVWRHKASHEKNSLAELGVSLLFIDSLGLGAAVSGQLNQIGQSCITVEAGETFVKLNAHQYVINTKKPEHYQQLIASIIETGLSIDQILHFWTYTDSMQEISSIDAFRQAQYHGLYSVLFLVQALVKVFADEEPPIRLCTFGSNTQIILADDTSTCEHSTLIGLLKTIPLETPWLSCCHVDLQIVDAQDNAQYVLNELQTINNEEEVAYRDGQRLVWGLARVDICDHQPVDVPLRSEGIYLITGGLGGIGSALAKYLDLNYQAKLILIGTTTLPPKDEWSTHIEQQGTVAERLRVYRELESLGLDFIYQPVDVSDHMALEAVVAAAELHWNDRLAGVFHLASGGDPTQHWKDMDLHRVSVQSIDSFESMFSSKVYGAWAIDQLLKHRPDAINVSFSSAISLFGGATFSAYSAAQSFLNCFSHRNRGHGHPNSYCIIWSVWDEVGRSKSDPEFVRQVYQSAGYFMIPVQQGFNSLIAALARDLPNLVVGLDASKQNIYRFLLDESWALQNLAACYTTYDGYPFDLPNTQEIEICDRFDTATQCELTHFDEMPMTDKGIVDYSAMLTKRAKEEVGQQEITLPTNEFENQVASIWCDVLTVSANKMDIHTHFFQLGGNSLTATQVLSRLNQTFNIKLNMRDLFECATVCEVAKFAQQLKKELPAHQPDQQPLQHDYEALLENVENMSDEEVEQLLKSIQD